MDRARIIMEVFVAASIFINILKTMMEFIFDDQPIIGDSMGQYTELLSKRIRVGKELRERVRVFSAIYNSMNIIERETAKQKYIKHMREGLDEAERVAMDTVFKI